MRKFCGKVSVSTTMLFHKIPTPGNQVKLRSVMTKSCEPFPPHAFQKIELK